MPQRHRALSAPSQQRRVLSAVCGVILATALVACGGGTDQAADASPTPTAAVAVPVVAAAPQGQDATTELTRSGALNYVVYRASVGGEAIETTTVSGTVSNQIPAVAGTPAAGTLTLALSPVPLVVKTTDDWANFIWPAHYKGILGLGGNAGLVCDVDSTVRTDRVAMSHNMQAVTTLDELKGRTFMGYDCATATPTATSSYSFLPDGSLDADGDIVEADDVAALFSEDGLDIEGLSLKWRAYKIQQGGQTGYAAALLFVEANASTGIPSIRVELLLH